MALNRQRQVLLLDNCHIDKGRDRRSRQEGVRESKGAKKNDKEPQFKVWQAIRHERQRLVYLEDGVVEVVGQTHKHGEHRGVRGGKIRREEV